MKPFTLLSFLTCCLFGFSAHLKAQAPPTDSTGLPGDHFSLEGALSLFKEAASPEAFEKMLNTADNHVNNLDLNNDGEVDYIRVIDKMAGNDHVLILQVPVSATESQDIAVIELEKNGQESASIQIIGDEDIFGEERLVEPASNDNAYTDNRPPLVSGPAASLPDETYESINSAIVVNVWLWPCVRFVYAPAYRVWVSPWHWRAHPDWWHPWRPLRWHYYHPYRLHYQRGFIVVREHRLLSAHRLYAPVRVSSVTVRTRNAPALNHYRVTRRTTTVTGPGGRSATRTTTTIRGKNGKVQARKTTVRKKKRG